ncbi:MAG: TIGR02206 family membrane protein [Saprospiraceae bacterium]|nr:TIGR02206 family membrane protein [Saprospiraceae bacterium]
MLRQMLTPLFDTSNMFMAFTIMHWYPILLVSILMISYIFLAKKHLNDRQQILFGTGLAIIPALCVLSRMVFTSMEGTFSIQEELPLHLCRLLALILPFVIYFKNEKWFGITYFFTMVGTLQALLTPDLPQAAPHYSYMSYWVLHGVLIYLPIYCIVVFGFRIKKKDFINAVIAGNIYLLITLLINYGIGSNYFYTSHKPPSASLLDFLGPWPWYILSVELLSIVLFLIAMVPFMFKTRSKIAN